MRTDGDTIKRESTKKQVLSLRVQGYTLDDIAASLDISVETTKKIIKESIDELRRDKKEEAEEYLRILEMRKESVVKALMPKILQNNDVKSVFAWVKAEENYQKVAGYGGKDTDINITSDSPITYVVGADFDKWPPATEK